MLLACTFKSRWEASSRITALSWSSIAISGQNLTCFFDSSVAEGVQKSSDMHSGNGADADDCALSRVHSFTSNSDQWIPIHVLPSVKSEEERRVRCSFKQKEDLPENEQMDEALSALRPPGP